MSKLKNIVVPVVAAGIQPNGSVRPVAPRVCIWVIQYNRSVMVYTPSEKWGETLIYQINHGLDTVRLNCAPRTFDYVVEIQMLSEPLC